MGIDLDAYTRTQINGMHSFISVSGVLDEIAQKSTKGLAFRGQPDAYGNLLNSFARKLHGIRANQTGLELEQFLIRSFRSKYESLREVHADLPPPARIGAGFDLRCLSVMQHYEIPTRLLDWTTDRWIALFFACSSNYDKPGELWYYDRTEVPGPPRVAKLGNLDSLGDRSDDPPREPSALSQHAVPVILELDFALTPRMRAQRAHHTFCTEIWRDHAEFLVELMTASGPIPETRFGRVFITPNCKQTILDYLAESHGITADTVFPDMLGISRHLARRLDFYAEKVRTS